MVLRAYLIFNHVVNDAIGQAPLDKIKLGYGRAKALKLYALRPTKRIKKFLRVSVKTRLISNMDSEGSACRGVVCHVAIL